MEQAKDSSEAASFKFDGLSLLGYLLVKCQASEGVGRTGLRTPKTPRSGLK
jgi:hypothetical protein